MPTPWWPTACSSGSASRTSRWASTSRPRRPGLVLHPGRHDDGRQRRGAHGAARARRSRCGPEKTVDPAVMASSTVLKLQTIVARELAPTETAVVTVGSMHVGTKENIISERAELG